MPQRDKWHLWMGAILKTGVWGSYTEVPTFQVSISLVLEGIYQVQGVFFFLLKNNRSVNLLKQ